MYTFSRRNSLESYLRGVLVVAGQAGPRLSSLELLRWMEATELEGSYAPNLHLYHAAAGGLLLVLGHSSHCPGLPVGGGSMPGMRPEVWDIAIFVWQP